MLLGFIPASSIVAETLVLAVLLLPGYLALKVRDGLVEHERRSASEAWLPALLFDLPVYLVLVGLSQVDRLGITLTLAEEGFAPVTILYALGAAIVVGFFMGCLEDRRAIRRLMQWLGASQKGGISAWADGFLHAQDAGSDWAIVYLKDGRRFFGRPEYISPRGEDSTIMLTRCVYEDGSIDPVTWFEPNSEQEHVLNGPGILLPPDAEIARVHFVD